MYLVLGYSEVVALAIGGGALAIRGVALVVTHVPVRSNESKV